ncbi:MAG: hypothetical protein AB7R69_06255 [Candidatus Babeliales bacterium]
MHTQSFAEVIESSLTGWLAQSWQWNYFPQFGSLVTIKTEKRILFGIVHHVQTGTMDPARQPFAYQKTEEELLAEQPQIFEFLKTTFSCLIVGYLQDGTITYQCAPEPPKIHAFVEHATPELHRQFFNSHHYLHLLFGFSQQISNLDELLLALLKNMTTHTILTKEKVEHFIETLSLLSGNDYRRLKLFLQRIEPMIQKSL